MVSGQHRCAVGTFANRPDAEQVLNELKRAGVPIPQIFVVPIDSKQADPEEEFSETEVGAKAAAIVGSLVGAVGGCVAGLGLLLVPEASLVLAAGIWGAPLLATVAGAGIGAVSCGLLRALAGTETPEAQAGGEFEQNSSSEYLVMVEGTDDQVNQAETILSRLNKKYLKINLPSFSGHPILELLKTPDLWKSL